MRHVDPHFSLVGKTGADRADRGVVDVGEKNEIRDVPVKQGTEFPENLLPLHVGPSVRKKDDSLEEAGVDEIQPFPDLLRRRLSVDHIDDEIGARQRLEIQSAVAFDVPVLGKEIHLDVQLWGERKDFEVEARGLKGYR